MTAVDRLAQIEGRANAATEGPWDKWGYHVVHDCGHCTCGTGGTSYGHESGCGAEQIGQAAEPDADFIAHARTDVPDLVAALRAVLELHRESLVVILPDGESYFSECAQECTDDEGYSDYPCPTVRAITEALESRDR